MRSSLLVATLLLAVGCGPDEGGEDRSLNVTWSFASGDCASNAVTKVKVTWGPTGAVNQAVEFDCAAGQGKLGEVSPMGGEYGISAVGIDSAGVERYLHFGTTLTLGAHGTHGQPTALTLRPKPADVIVTWQMSGGGGCPGSTVLPYTITLYKPPAMAGGTPTMKASETQESCSKRTATLSNVTPGDYIVDLDSRAQSPMVKAQKAATLKPGENLTVDFQL